MLRFQVVLHGLGFFLHYSVVFTESIRGGFKVFFPQPVMNTGSAGRNTGTNF